jgi:hypothetical protein
MASIAQIYNFEDVTVSRISSVTLHQARALKQSVIECINLNEIRKHCVVLIAFDFLIQGEMH